MSDPRTAAGVNKMFPGTLAGNARPAQPVTAPEKRPVRWVPPAVMPLEILTTEGFSARDIGGSCPGHVTVPTVTVTDFYSLAVVYGIWYTSTGAPITCDDSRMVKQAELSFTNSSSSAKPDATERIAVFAGTFAVAGRPYTATFYAGEVTTTDITVALSTANFATSTPVTCADVRLESIYTGGTPAGPHTVNYNTVTGTRLKLATTVVHVEVTGSGALTPQGAMQPPMTTISGWGFGSGYVFTDTAAPSGLSTHDGVGGIKADTTSGGTDTYDYTVPFAGSYQVFGVSAVYV